MSGRVTEEFRAALKGAREALDQHKSAQQAANIDWMRDEARRNGTVAAKQGSEAVMRRPNSEVSSAGSGSDPAGLRTSSEFYDALAKANAWFANLTPEQKRAHREAQRRSWCIGETMLAHPEMSRTEAEKLYERASR